MKISLASLFVLFFSVSCATTSSMPFFSSPRVTGTYSDMFVHEPTGEVVGTEIRIVETSSGLQGALQIGGGDLTGLSELLVVDVYHEGSEVWFTIPEGHRLSGSFRGTIKRNGLVGTLTLTSGEDRFLVLERTRSIWD